ncbi:MAG: hypothetical protein KDE45_19750, partial [Caldilineaceae bacterium]|nr:hypothetical protein [Caldilineaceae bacterium]
MQRNDARWIAIYPVAAYRDQWAGQENDIVATTLDALQSLLADQPDAPDAPMPVLPPVPATNDLAVQPAYVDFGSGSGVRFVGRYVQAADPIYNGQLLYVYQGLTDDGRYLIGAQWPVATTAAADALDSAADDEWTPTLSSLDTAFASLIIQGPGPTLTIDDLGNMEYQSMLLEKPVLLTNGIYTETVVPDSA